MYRDVGIFMPVYFREELVIQSLETLLISNFSGLNVFLCIGINGANDSFKEYLKGYERMHGKSKFKYIDIFEAKMNHGKPRIINLMSGKNNIFDFLVSMDSDIQTADPDWLRKLIHVYDHYYEVEPISKNHPHIGALCANQTGNSVHQAVKLGKMSMKLDGYTLVTTATNQGVAGGVLMTPKHVWNRIGGYRASNIYGSDDGAYVVDCKRIDHIMAYIQEIKCYHPPEDDIKYAEWKMRSCNGELEPHEKAGYYESL